MKNRTHYISLIFFLAVSKLLAQTPKTIVKGFGYSGTINETLIATESITLSNGVTINSGSSFVAKISPDAYLLPVFSDANYVFSRIYQEKLKSASEIVNNQDVVENITYFDGLGRPIQNITIKGSPSKQDIITPIGYDDFGRQDKDYLPYMEASGSIGSYRSSAFINANSYYVSNYPLEINSANPNPFSQKQFDGSPLNLIQQQAAPGNDWSLSNNHTIKMDYQTNTDGEVKQFKATTVWDAAKGLYVPTLGQSATYAAGQLYKTITKDENWKSNQPNVLDNTVEEFKDKEGHVVLKRTYNNNVAHDTYYVYDVYGNLTYVIPPLVNTGSLITTQVVSSGYYDFNKYLDQRLFTGKNGGGGITVSIISNVLKVVFSAGFESTMLLETPQYLGTLPCNLPDMTIGTILGGKYRASIVGGAFKLTNLQGAAVTGFSETLTVTLTNSCTASVSIANETILNDLCYRYKYDDRNRLVEKKLPGKDWEFIVYDKLDRVVLTQDANLKAESKWLFTKYDVFNRPVYTGEYINTANRDALQTQVSAGATLSEKRQGVTTIGDSSAYYSNLVIPNTSITLYTVNYYDDYGFDLAGGVSETVGGITPITNVKGLATGSRIRTLGTTLWTTNVQYYDAKGRQIYAYSKNDYLSTVDKVRSTLDFTGKATQTETRHKKGTNTELVVVDSFEYDHAGRLFTQKQVINGSTQEIIASNTYDSLGQLVSKGVGGKTTQNRLQNVDYKYNIRGWLKNINDTNTMGNDLFSFAINYNTPTDASKALYNGNISQTFWRTANSDTSLKNYLYSYDALNRLTNATDNLNKLNESIEYDLNGNITKLIRLGEIVGGSTIPNISVASHFGIMDNLKFTYDSGNKLQIVSDSANDTYGFKDDLVGTADDTTTDYTYDANGNMKTDVNKGINGIAYNHLNLPTQVTIGGKNIDYIYDATGKKLRKVINDTTVTTTDYAGGFQYLKVGAAAEALQFFSTAEGYVEHNSGNYSYVYQYKDHLGNVRLAYKDSNNDGAVTAAEILSEDNYYPFGLKHKGYNSNVVNSNNKYKYQGKELQDELGLNIYDYGARNYDSALGRWMNIDPLAEETPDWTSYSLCFNNPLFFVDPDGRSAWHPNENGDLVADAGDSTKSLAEYQGISYDQAAKQLSDNGYKVNDSGILNLNVGDVVNTGSVNLEAVVVRGNSRVSNTGLSSGDPTADRNISTLDPRIRKTMTSLIVTLRAEGIDVRGAVQGGFRTYAEQDLLYQIGRTTQLNRATVTGARGGQSNHNFGLSMDVAIYQNGKYLKKGTEWQYARYGTIAKKKFNLDWGGDWKRFDPAHVEYRHGKSMKALRESPKDSNGYLLKL